MEAKAFSVQSQVANRLKTSGYRKTVGDKRSIKELTASNGTQVRDRCRIMRPRAPRVRQMQDKWEASGRQV